MQRITPCLWCNDQAGAAARCYVSIFKHSKILSVARYGEAGASASGRPKGSVMTVAFRLDGQEFLALNGGPEFTFSPAISFIVNCKTQKEIDDLWRKLSANEQAERCGWLKDKYGVSWQIVPAALSKMMEDKAVRKPEKVMEALLQMNKLDIKTLRQAYESSKASSFEKKPRLRQWVP